jgi:hypothetical protein
MFEVSDLPCSGQPDSSQLAAEMAVDLFGNWFDPIETEVRARAREFIEEMSRGELDTVLSRPRYSRSQMADNEGRADIAITSRADAGTYAKHGYYHNFGGACDMRRTEPDTRFAGSLRTSKCSELVDVFPSHKPDNAGTRWRCCGWLRHYQPALRSPNRSKQFLSSEPLLHGNYACLLAKTPRATGFSFGREHCR